MQQILFITLSNIGDAIMTTPTLERLHQLYPDASIDLVCDNRSQIIFTHCPYRGEIFVKKKKRDGQRVLFQFIKTLRRKRYDLVVDLRTDGLAYLLRAKKRLTRWGHKPYGPHAVEDLISIIHKINPEKVLPDTKIWIDDKHMRQADELTSGLNGNHWLAIGPGANWAPKVWDSENFAKVANGLHDKIDAVIIIGTTKDTKYSQKVTEKLESPYLDLSGKTDLLTVSAILKKCSLFLGNDSGLGHLASAVNTPSITVFGPGIPERYHPWSKKNQWFRGKDKLLENLDAETVTQGALELIHS